jgi:hypothetical protein
MSYAIYQYNAAYTIMRAAEEQIRAVTGMVRLTANERT